MKKILSVLFVITFLFTTISTTFTMPERALAASGTSLNESQLKKIQKEIEILKLLKKEYDSLDKQKKALLKKKLKRLAAIVDIKLKVLHKKIKKKEKEIIKEIETKVIPAINKALWIYKQTMEILDNVNEIIEQMIEAENQMIKGLDQMNAAVDGMNKEMDNVIHSMNEANKAMDECNQALDVMIETTNEMTKEVNDATANTNQMIRGVNQANKGMKQLNKSTNKLNTAIKKTNRAFDNYDKKSNKVKNKKITKKQAKKIKKQKEQLKRAQNKVDNANKNLKKNEKTLNEGALGLSILLDLTPLVSNIKGGAEFVFGEDLVTHERLTGYERTLAGMSVLTSGTFKLAGKAMGMSSKTAKTAKIVEDGAKSGKAGFDVASFEKKIAKMNLNEKIPLVRTTAADFAKQRNWKKDSKLTKINKRDVYLDSKTGKYYAVDTQHGRFEVVNKRGKHQGEVDFNLNETKPADKSGRHDLKMK
ncbi:pre-toxin TG domain-containing protein [Bacillus swezeyi]|nr:pre-toxin TG domain-containing protein [Bacillus swezeyi]MEC1260003.1 pre-toxin TG domain-containing protein [Bacillus swezeyi]MED2929765.1 pre-toxin TG domain-containing protein [Bacillus swezeyi]MED2963208.1 pre-toxin TG domain-containing protein [Bacillus swezeyi]MED3073159.1 pre-toxin TG domain-containing protein [Bacillus swezeyi]MED3082762.1 pre-toxin TG domain-containing protein [Bacillus swezeyi]